MEIPPSHQQASIPSTFLAPTLISRVLHSTVASTITSNTIQTTSLYVSTLLGSTIQTNTLYSSTINNNNIWINSLSTSSLVGSTIQTDTLFPSFLTGSTIRINELYVNSSIGSTIQINICDALISSSTIQSNTLNVNTAIGSTIQTNILMISTLIGSTIQLSTLNADILTGSTIQSNTIKVSTISGSTLQNNQLNTGITLGSTLLISTIQPYALQFSTILGSTIQTRSTIISTLIISDSTIQTNNFNYSTIIGSSIQTYATNPSTLLGDVLIGCTITVNAVNFSTLFASNIQAKLLNVSTLIGSTSQISRGDVLSTIQYSTLIGSTIQTYQFTLSTITACTIQNSTLQMSTLTSNTIQQLFSTLNISSLIAGSTIQTSTLSISTLSSSTIQTNILQVSTLLGSTLQTKQLNISTLQCSTLQTDILVGSTIIYSTIQTSTLFMSTMVGSTIIGSTITLDTLQVSTITCSTIIRNNFQPNNIVTTDGNNALLAQLTYGLSLSATNPLQLQYITGLVSQAGGTTQLNTWVSTQTFSTSSIYFDGLTTNTPVYTLGLNASNQMIQYLPPLTMAGTMIQNYIPYAIGTSTLSNSLLYRVNSTEFAIGRTTSVFPETQVLVYGSPTYGEYITFDLGTGGNYHNRFYNQAAAWTTIYQVHFLGSDDNVIWFSLGIVTAPNGDGSGNYNYTLSNKRYLRLVILRVYNAYNAGNNSILLYNVTITQDGGTNLFTNINQVSISSNLTQGNTTWSTTGIQLMLTPYSGTSGQVSSYTGDTFILPVTQATGGPTPYTLSVAGNTQVTNVITETATFSKINTPDKRTGFNGIQIPGNQGCNFYMGTMNNNNSGNYTDTLYLNSVPSFDTTDSYNVRNSVVVTSAGAGFVTMPSLTTSATTPLTFSILLIYTGSSKPAQWSRILDIGNTTSASGPTRNFDISYNINNGGTLRFEYRASDDTLTYIDSSIQLGLNTMYHVVWTINTSGSHVMYINGTQVCTMTKAITAFTYPNFYLGKSNWTVDPYPNMTIFDFRMINRYLSSSDVLGLYYTVKKITAASTISGQYILLNRPNGAHLNLAEIQVFSYEGGPNIITPSTSVTFPDARGDFPATNFVDGSLSTIVHSQGTTNSTLTVNLGSTQTIYKIIIYNRGDCCFTRAHGIVVTIQNSSGTVVYTANAISDKTGISTPATGNESDAYKTFTYFPPYAAMIGDYENTTLDDVNIVMFNKGTPGMRIYKGLNNSAITFSNYKDLIVTEANSDNVSIGAGSDTAGITFGPNVSWSSYLKIGSGTNRSGTNTAQVISTNGNLHLDAGSNSRGLYLNYYVRDNGAAIYSYTPLTHANDLTVSSNIYVRWGIASSSWFYNTSANIMYWNSYGRGMCSPETAGNSYGTVSTYGTGRNGWHGWGCGGSKVTLMTNNTTFLIHDNTHGWVIWTPNLTNDRTIILGGGSVQCGQWWDRILVYFNGYNTGSGYWYVNQAGGCGSCSDNRIKTDIKPIDMEQSITFIRGIIPSFFCLKEQKPCLYKHPDGREEMVCPSVCTCEQTGFIAQNVLASAKKAGLPRSTVANTYDYEQELLLPEEERKTKLGVNVLPMITHAYNALKGTIKKQDIQQTQIDEINVKYSMLDTGLTTLQETVRQNAELLQQLMAKTQ
jgi:hypothetical protein